MDRETAMGETERQTQSKLERESDMERLGETDRQTQSSVGERESETERLGVTERATTEVVIVLQLRQIERGS